MSGKTSHKPTGKTLYLDAVSAEALEFLKARSAPGGMRFSLSALFREFLASLRQNPEAILSMSGWTRRAGTKGTSVYLLLMDTDRESLEWLEDYHRRHAADERRVRDGSPKGKRFPLSLLFAQAVRDQAVLLGWRSPESDR